MHAALVVVGALLQLHACESYTLSESCQLPKSLGGAGPLPAAFGARSMSNACMGSQAIVPPCVPRSLHPLTLAAN